jgi:hypothetical protein
MRAGSGETEPAFPCKLGGRAATVGVSRLRVGTKADAKHLGFCVLGGRDPIQNQSGPKGARGCRREGWRLSSKEFWFAYF